jgi:hypothetical protein
VQQIAATAHEPDAFNRHQKLRWRAAAFRLGPAAVGACADAVLRQLTMALEVLHSSTQNGISWQVYLRPDLCEAGAQLVIEFRKSGKRGKLLDQVIGWRPAGWCSAPSSKIPKYLLERIAAVLQQRLTAPVQADQAALQALVSAEAPDLTAMPELPAPLPPLRFPSFLSDQLLAQHCPGYLARHSAPGA